MTSHGKFATDVFDTKISIKKLQGHFFNHENFTHKFNVKTIKNI